MTERTRNLRRRQRKELLFRAAGFFATGVGMLFLGVFFTSLIAKGASAFTQTHLRLDFTLSAARLAPAGTLNIDAVDFDAVVRDSLVELFPDVTDRAGRAGRQTRLGRRRISARSSLCRL